MDLKAYYRRIRELENSIEQEYVVIKSLPTEAGGQGGRLTEAPRAAAARMIVDGVVELASGEETREFHERAAEALRQEGERRRAAQVQFSIISEADLQALARSPRAQGVNHGAVYRRLGFT